MTSAPSLLRQLNGNERDICQSKREARRYNMSQLVMQEEMSSGYVVFKLAGERYGISLDAVREIGRVPPVTPIPGADHFVVGVCSLRGNIVAIIDLHTLFELDGEDEILAGNRMLILSHADMLAGLLVDAIEGVLHIDNRVLDPPLPGLPDGLRSFLVGHLRHGDTLIAIIDTNILASLRTRLEEAVA